MGPDNEQASFQAPRLNLIHSNIISGDYDAILDESFQRKSARNAVRCSTIVADFVG